MVCRSRLRTAPARRLWRDQQHGKLGAGRVHFDGGAFGPDREPPERVLQHGSLREGGQLFWNAARNVLRGPSQGNIDLALSKRTAIGERLHAEFRGEFFNLTNTPNFTSPNGSITSSSFGEITTITGNPRVAQFALKVMF